MDFVKDDDEMEKQIKEYMNHADAVLAAQQQLRGMFL